jgi:hypothetical protein
LVLFPIPDGQLFYERLLRDPKPLVIGIGWVVECAEQQKRVEEAEFLVDLENAHFAGTNKVSFMV